MVCLIGLDQHYYHMLQCRYHWGWLLMPTHYLTLPTLVSAFSVLFVCYPLEALKWRLTHHINPIMSALPRIAHTVLRKKFESPGCFFPAAARRPRGRPNSANSAESINALFIPAQTASRQPRPSLPFGPTERGATSFIKELVGNCHGRQQWLCVIFG